MDQSLTEAAESVELEKREIGAPADDVTPPAIEAADSALNEEGASADAMPASVDESIRADDGVEAEAAKDDSEAPKDDSEAPILLTNPIAAEAENAPAAELIPPPRGRAFWRRVDLYQAAGVIVSLGAGWILGANTFDYRSDIVGLQSQIAALRGRVAMIQTDKATASSATAIVRLEHTQSRLATAIGADKIRLERSDRRAQAQFEKIATAINRLDKSQRLQAISARVDRLEQRMSASLPTGSIAPMQKIARKETPAAQAAAPRPVKSVSATPAPMASAAAKRREEDEMARRRSIPPDGYVLRDVYRGAALIETRRGLRIVAPGDFLPGAGRIMRIAKRGRGWVVVTSDGVIDANNY